MVPSPDKKKNAPPVQAQLMVSALSGSIAVCFTNPFDVLKTRLQLYSSPGRQGMMHVLSSVVRTEGVPVLFSGLNAAVLRAAVYTSTRLGLYEPTKKMLNAHGMTGTSSRLFAGMITGCIGGVVGNPLELIKVRMQASAGGQTTILKATQNVVREGGALALWRGLTPTMLRSSLLTATQVGVYDEFKATLKTNLALGDGFGTQLAASLGAGLVSTTVVNPADVVKTRLMNDRKVHGRYRGVIHCFYETVSTEGVAALWKGWVPSYVRLGPHTTIMMLVFELARNICGWDEL